MFNRLNFNIENERVGEETAKQIKYMLERKSQLEQEVRAGLDAAKELGKLEERLKANMIVYIGISGSIL